MIKQLTKKVLKAVAPNYFSRLMAARENAHGQRVLIKNGVPAIAEDYLSKIGPTVKSGPFAGMKYLSYSTGSALIPKLVGSYECELHPVITRLIDTTIAPYDVVVDIGCAEGYYAVGLALHLPGKPKVYAYDLDIGAQKQCRTLAELNDVSSQVTVLGNCETMELQDKLHGKSLVVCDCEGYEWELLDPIKAPALISADILVELHDFRCPGLTPKLRKRFLSTHSIEVINSMPRNTLDYPQGHFLPFPQQEIALSEFRNGPQQWAFFSPIR